MKKIRRILAAVLGSVLMIACLGGCGLESRKVFDQAERDLSRGSYEYALAGYLASIEAEDHVALSLRGAGICCLRLGRVEEAEDYFTQALNCENVGKTLIKDILCYRITTRLIRQDLDAAMGDCGQLSRLGDMDADGYFLTGKTALAMNVYKEAASNFEQAYLADPTYERALQIYEVYLDEEMEADGTHFLDLALEKEAKTAQDHLERGRMYYYMEDYNNARIDLIEAMKQNNLEAQLLLGMVYLAKGDISNSRAMYIQYMEKGKAPGSSYNGLAMCDMAEWLYDSALENIKKGIPLATTEELKGLMYNEMVIYEKKLDFASALRSGEEYLSLFPDDEEAAREVAFLRSRV